MGVQITLRTGVVGLPGRVMGLLGLSEEWLDAEEAENSVWWDG